MMQLNIILIFLKSFLKQNNTAILPTFITAGMIPTYKGSNHSVGCYRMLQEKNISLCGHYNFIQTPLTAGVYKMTDNSDKKCHSARDSVNDQVKSYRVSD